VDIQRWRNPSGPPWPARSAGGGGFRLFGKDLADRQRAFEEEIRSESTARVRGSMESVEKEVNALKASAYQNVSEKLKVFEDEFFADLKSRARNRKAPGRMAGDAGRAPRRDDSRRGGRPAEAAKAAAENLKTALAELQGRLFEQLGKLSEQAQVFRTA
jgi:hypothetical protein